MFLKTFGWTVEEYENTPIDDIQELLLIMNTEAKETNSQMEQQRKKMKR